MSRPAIATALGKAPAKLWLVIASFGLAARMVVSAQASHEELLTQAKAAYATGKRPDALALAAQAIAIEPKNPRGYFFRARFYEEYRELAKAIADYDEVIKLDPRLPDAWQNRGSTHFKLGHINESIADFDRFIELAPAQAPNHWQRGISLYYA